MAKSEIIPTSFRIKEILEEKQLNQVQLAEGIGVSPSAVKQFLDAKSLNTSTLQKIARFLDVPLWQLFISPDRILEEAKESSLGTDKVNCTSIICPHCKKDIVIQFLVSKST